MKKLCALLLALSLMLSLAGCVEPNVSNNGNVPAAGESTANVPVVTEGTWNPGTDVPFAVDDIPAYDGQPYAVVNDNMPFFDTTAIPTNSVEFYSELDELGRCGVTYANVGQDIMPTEKRGNISSVKPTGWQSAQYDHVDGKHLYNRCHLIGFQLSAENANKQNLITGTRSLNVDGMLPFENIVADYVKETNNHVAYRVTPIFNGDELVARGVLMEGWSVEDGGESVAFCVFAPNVQPGVEIDYATGNSWLAGEGAASSNKGEKETYILNTGTKKFHREDCKSAADTRPENKETFTGSRQELIDQGYEPCKRCNP